ncbi:MAG: hypothetical protein J5585_00570 [Clostridia bacterium]|nr:hypothetical protein [Clostridia bacterium]
MKKIIAIIMTVSLIFAAAGLTVNAAENEWTVYAAAVDYRDTYSEDEPLPNEPGLKYTDLGVQMYSADEYSLKRMGANAWGTIQTKEKVSYKNGLTMTVLVDGFNNSGADKWISFSIWDSQKISQGATGYGCGWFCLVRPTSSGCSLESWLCTPTVAMKNLAMKQCDTNIYEGEALQLEIKAVDGKYSVFVNGVDMKAEEFVQFMENDEAYIGLTGHQGVREQFSFTITEFNGAVPTGTEAIDPYVPDLGPEPVPIPPSTPEGEPCWLWSAERVKYNVPGIGMTSVVNDDGSLHITFDENMPQINTSVRTGSYKAEEFPVWAILFKGLDETDASGVLWYCAGEVYSAQDGSELSVRWDACDYDEDNDTGWRIMTVDLGTENTWDGMINGFLLAVASAGVLTDTTADIMWIGFFRSEKDAYEYAGMGDYFARENGLAPATQADTTEAATDAATEPDATADVTDDVTTDAPETQPSEPGKKSGGGAVIWITVGAVAAIAAVTAVIVAVRRKKK